MKNRGLVENIFYTYMLKQRDRLIKKTKQRIDKYERKILSDKIYLDWLRRDTKSMIEHGSYIGYKEEPLLRSEESKRDEENIIDLSYIIFSINKSYLATEEWGRKIYEIISDKIDYDKMNIIKFPDNITKVSISFCNGFYEGILKNIQKR